MNPAPVSPGARARLGTFIWRDGKRIRAAATRGQEAVTTCRLRGGSMEPAIPARSWVRIAVGAQRCRRGDIVAFTTADRIVVHRVVYRAHRSHRGLLITRGDACLLPDPPIDPDSVIGRVTQIHAGAGWCAPGAASNPPRRDRLLAALALATTALLMECNASVARRFAAWLWRTDTRTQWTTRLLY